MPLFKVNVLFFAVLALLTLYLHGKFAQHDIIGENLLSNAWEIPKTNSGNIEVSNEGLTIHAADGYGIISAQQIIPLPPPGATLKLSAQARSIGVVPGQKSWNVARLILVQHDGNQDNWQLPHTVAVLSGSHDWKDYRRAIPIAVETKQIRVIAQLNKASGVLQLKNLQLYPVLQSSAYPIIKNAILAAWASFFFSLLGCCLAIRTVHTMLRWMFLFTLLAIVIGTTMTGDMKQEVAFEVVAQMNAHSDPIKALIPWDLSKVWHFAFFLLLGAVLGMMTTQYRYWHGMIIASLVAGGTELMQLYIEGRSALFADFLLDVSGSMLGLVFIGIIRFLWRH